MASKLSAQMKKTRRPVSADGFTLKRGTMVWEIGTRDGGKTWHVYGPRMIRRTNMRGMVSFEDKPFAWHYCWPLADMVGDHRIFVLGDAARKEVSKRNRKMSGRVTG